MNRSGLIFSGLVVTLVAALFYFYPPQPIFEFSIAQDKIRQIVAHNSDYFLLVKHLQVDEGDLVTIKMTADVDDELHIHGYDLRLPLEKGVQAEVFFKADVVGKFQMELVTTKTDLGIIEVLPK